MDVPSPHAGVVKEVLVKVGDKVRRHVLIKVEAGAAAAAAAPAAPGRQARPAPAPPSPGSRRTGRRGPR
jgi:pyruvate dehydrogenase E2 component (dihydrolipoamide acetyltransferase)